MSSTPALEQEHINAKRDSFVMEMCAKYTMPAHIGELAQLLKVAYQAGATAGIDAAQNLIRSTPL